MAKKGLNIEFKVLFHAVGLTAFALSKEMIANPNMEKIDLQKLMQRFSEAIKNQCQQFISRGRTATTLL